MQVNYLNEFWSFHNDLHSLYISRFLWNVGKPKLNNNYGLYKYKQETEDLDNWRSKREDKFMWFKMTLRIHLNGPKSIN